MRQTRTWVGGRMIGRARGTGYSEGVPYPAEARAVPVFACPYGHHRMVTSQGSVAA